MAPNVEKLTVSHGGSTDGIKQSPEIQKPLTDTIKIFKPQVDITLQKNVAVPLYTNQNGQSSQLFANKQNATPQNIADRNILPEAKANRLGTLSKYIKAKLNGIAKQVNEYDAAVNNALKYLPSKGDLKDIVNSNPRIAAILAEANLPVKMNYDNLKTIKHSHIATTVQFARSIGQDLGLSETELQTMEVGAALHDIGKTLIPEEILNKKGRLTDDERKVVNLHAVLGYEILKSAGFGTNVAEIARDHHNPLSKNKYAQIVRAADVYSAMREERSYKKGKSHEEAMAVLRNMNIDKNILNSLDKNYGSKNTVTAQGFSTQLVAC